ncbi:hypothetical protein V5799_024142 [Amblyomma americanum]|uniref:BZIP domain-containing protein n=1 Tax=Amblyomma americanum TaxID=6943 RepID=A0AAQ4ECY3_AMBAM
MVEAREVLHQTAIAIVCKGAMDRQQYTNDYAEHLTDRLKASVLLVQDSVFSKSCTGAVTDKGTACLACRYLRKGLQARRSRVKMRKPVKRNLRNLLKFSRQKTKRLLNGLLKSSFNTPAGEVSLWPVREALKLDGTNVTLQAMPGIRSCHVNSNNFEKMRVSYAFQLFGDTVLNGLRLYKTELEASGGSLEPVLTFFGMIRDLIEIMTSRFPAKALRPGSVAEGQLLSFLAYLTEWELHAGVQGGFLSASTAVGLRVTELLVLTRNFTYFVPCAACSAEVSFSMPKSKENESSDNVHDRQASLASLRRQWHASSSATHAAVLRIVIRRVPLSLGHPDRPQSNLFSRKGEKTEANVPLLTCLPGGLLRNRDVSSGSCCLGHQGQGLLKRWKPLPRTPGTGGPLKRQNRQRLTRSTLCAWKSKQPAEQSAEEEEGRGGRRGRRSSGSSVGAAAGRSSRRGDMKAKLERSRQSARECRARKKLRYQYLEELVADREKAVLVLRQELDTYRQYFQEMDQGNIPEAVLEILEKDREEQQQEQTVLKHE